MKSLIVTVAGLSSRFNQDLEEKKLKCLYYRESYKESLLYQIISKADAFQEIVIVGGYKFDDLSAFVNEELKEYRERIHLIYNDHFQDYGSGYSLYLGIKGVREQTDEIVFAEGDLFFKENVFEELSQISNDVITINSEPIFASKAVVLYVDNKKFIHYLYNTSHGELEIKEPFLAVFNSGQIWKFMDVEKLKILNDNLTEEQKQGTNLEVIQKYFADVPYEDCRIVPVDGWINCNTVMDYENMLMALRR